MCFIRAVNFWLGPSRSSVNLLPSETGENYKKSNSLWKFLETVLRAYSKWRNIYSIKIYKNSVRKVKVFGIWTKTPLFLSSCSSGVRNSSPDWYNQEHRVFSVYWEGLLPRRRRMSTSLTSFCWYWVMNDCGWERGASFLLSRPQSGVQGCMVGEAQCQIPLPWPVRRGFMLGDASWEHLVYCTALRSVSALNQWPVYFKIKVKITKLPSRKYESIYISTRSGSSLIF